MEDGYRKNGSSWWGGHVVRYQGHLRSFWYETVSKNWFVSVVWHVYDLSRSYFEELQNDSQWFQKRRLSLKRFGIIANASHFQNVSTPFCAASFFRLSASFHWKSISIRRATNFLSKSRLPKWPRNVPGWYRDASIGFAALDGFPRSICGLNASE